MGINKVFDSLLLENKGQGAEFSTELIHAFCQLSVHDIYNKHAHTRFLDLSEL